MIPILTSLRVVENSTYPEKRDAISHDWIRFLEKMNICPILFPNAISSPVPYLRSLGRVDGVLLTSGNDHGVSDSPDASFERDRTEESLIRYAQEQKLPIIGVCRGLHVMNCYFGGSVVSSLQKKGNGNHVGTHCVNLLRERMDLPEEWKDRFEVNSYHNHGVTWDTLSREMCAFAVDDRGVIEGIRHKDQPFFGIQWHPERPGSPAHIDSWIFDIYSRK